MSEGLNLISVHDLERRRGCRNCLIIDLRDPGSFAAGHVPGAVNLPFEDYDRWSRTLPGNKNLILYCERGNSAMQAGRKLTRAGYMVEIVSGGYQSIRRTDGTRGDRNNRIQ